MKLNYQQRTAGASPQFQREKCEYPMLAMVYAPRQSWRMIYDGEKALVKGTIFGELDKPFLGYGKARGCEVRR
ncbi:MAG: spore coat associated protein CotJA [Clostridia bacterium]|nr:spore coat associated protein CotJA [Clostridia bacterium]